MPTERPPSETVFLSQILAQKRQSSLALSWQSVGILCTLGPRPQPTSFCDFWGRRAWHGAWTRPTRPAGFRVKEFQVLGNLADWCPDPNTFPVFVLCPPYVPTSVSNAPCHGTTFWSKERQWKRTQKTRSGTYIFLIGSHGSRPRKTRIHPKVATTNCHNKFTKKQNEI